MTKETKIELAIVVIVAIIIGTWIGVKLISTSSEPGTSKPPDTSDTQPADDQAVQNNDPEQEPPVQEVEKPLPQENIDPLLTAGLSQAKILTEEGKLFEARKTLTPLIIKAPEGELRNSIKNQLDKLNDALFWSKHVKTPDSIIYTIQSGDMLQPIARKHGGDSYSYELLLKINKIRNARNIRVGQKIKIPKGSFSALIQKRKRRLTIFLNDHYIKEYPVGIGAPKSPTPEDTFKVGKGGKQKNPEWTAPDGNVYPYGHPKNVLGTRWIGFEDKGDHVGYGIHGTADPGSIGKAMSNGCIRMLTNDVEEVFAILTPDDIIIIQR
jgi:LysM repeat protein